MKNIVLPAIVGTVILFLLGGLFYGLIFKSTMDAGMASFGAAANSDPNLLIVFCCHLIFIVMMCLLFEKLNLLTTSSILKTAVVVSVALAVWFELWMIVSFNVMSSALITADLTSNIISSSAGAAAAGLTRARLAK